MNKAGPTPSPERLRPPDLVPCEQRSVEFGVPKRTLKRYTSRYRESGLSAFIKPAARRVGHRLTPERLVAAQALLDGGMDVAKVSEQTGILVTTVRKAIQAGRLRDQKKSVCSGLHRSGLNQE